MLVEVIGVANHFLILAEQLCNQKSVNLNSNQTLPRSPFVTIHPTDYEILMTNIQRTWWHYPAMSV